MAIIEQNGQPGKICTKCKEWQPVLLYRKRLLSRDGYDYICNVCVNAASRAWRAKNKQRVQELNREFYEANRAARLEYHRQYRQTHKEYFKEQLRIFRQKNPTYHATVMREWARAHPDVIKAKDNARRIFKMGKPASFTAAEWKALKAQYNYTCLRCGRQEPAIKLTADHIVPISKGGVGTIDNIQPLCRPCNTAKHDDTIDYRPDW
jgi:5-methylcytosine-specific restriction endonuclease McrA